MHELAVCQSLLDEVARLAYAEHATTVTRITVRCGPLSGVEPHLLARAFDIARAASVAPRAELVIEPEPVIVYCDDCSKQHQVRSNRLRCPECGKPCAHLVSGDALILASIALDREARAPAVGPATRGVNRHV